jgi:hypothetical protein
MITSHIQGVPEGLYRTSGESYVKLHRYNQKDLNPNWDVFGDNGERNFSELEMLITKYILISAEICSFCNFDSSTYHLINI